jgi:hypothetical protein
MWQMVNGALNFAATIDDWASARFQHRSLKRMTDTPESATLIVVAQTARITDAQSLTSLTF